MPLAEKEAYADCYSILDWALADEKGCKIRCVTESRAIGLRNRLNAARALDRENEVSMYDPLAILVREFEGEWYVYLEKNAIEAIEE